MSRIGKKPIPVPGSVKISLNPKTRTIDVEGAKGKLRYQYHQMVDVAWDESEKQVVCSVAEDQMNLGPVRAQWGTTRARIANMIQGASQGYSKKMEVVGVGWNAKLAGKKIQLNIGYCHPVELEPPPGVEFVIEGQFITVSGVDKHSVGQFAAVIRSKRPPEPYNGKGIKYTDEIIIRKQGKVFGA